MNLSAIQAKIQSEVKDEISKNQRDYFLREQMRAINRELGEGDDRAQEIEDYQKKIRKSGMPQGSPGRGRQTASPAGADAFRLRRSGDYPNVSRLDG